MNNTGYSTGEILRSASRTYIERDRKETKTRRRTRWELSCYILTFLIPDKILSCFGMSDQSTRDAWREKVTLCMLIFYSCCILAFLTYGINMFVCRGEEKYLYSKLKKINFFDESLIAKGGLFRMDDNFKYREILSEYKTKNCTSLFQNKEPSCMARFKHKVIDDGMDGLGLKLKDDDVNLKRIGDINFTWNDIHNLNYIVIEDKAYDASQCTEGFYSDFIKTYMGKDATSFVKDWTENELECFKRTFLAGRIMTKSYGCLVADFILYMSTVAIFSLILIRFFLAIFYSWMMRKQTRILLHNSNNVDSKMPCILLVTCYSEDKEGLKGTIDSLCNQDYDERYKLIIVIADGIIKGSNNEQTTPEILLGLFEEEYTYPVEPKNYLALASGSKRYNRASVYTGIYKTETRRTKIMFIVKTGNPEEIGKSKPGNRGKRDSQVILMGFFQRLIYEDRMSELDYDIYRKMKKLLPNVEPAHFECILMVDADTEVKHDALAHMVRVFESDQKIMGMCGETKITNKAESWVTMIQVFEYYISHHLSKSFESVFGGVTCLPGCFCMYRIQCFKVEDERITTMPLLAHPFIINEYSVFETKSLHQKNLLLLGEDRYLTTLLLKNFYRRKLIFCPAAQSETQVPSSFKILLSQRRRWINSTIHNLFELVLVDKLCGTFCCSMQFVVIMELMGTLVLPAAIIFTFVLIISSIVNEPAWIPLIMLFGILGLPAFLIGLTTFEFSYFFWIIIYILSLPIWNLILPLYAFWHFDDFSWGETRKIEGDDGKNHGETVGKFDPSVFKLAHLDDFIKNTTIDEKE